MALALVLFDDQVYQTKSRKLRRADGPRRLLGLVTFWSGSGRSGERKLWKYTRKNAEI